MATQVWALPDDALAGVFRALPLQSLAVVRCVCKAWRGIVDDRALLLPHLLPHSVQGVFINYKDRHRPYYFARPCSPSTIPRVDGKLSFMSNAESCHQWSVLDHCNGLLLCDIDWSSELCVCNPATRRWTVLPGHRGTHGKPRRHCYASAHIAFDPAVSPHYQVVLVPDVPEVPSLQERRRAEKERRAFGDNSVAFGEQHAQDQEFQPLPSFDEAIDPCRFKEWPPTPWMLHVFSSRTGEWEERPFVREGMPAGTVYKIRLYPRTSYWTRWRYGVYHHQSLYMHCRGSFVARLSLSNSNYQVVETPANIKSTKSYLGKLQNSVCFGIIHDHQLKVWILNESCGQMEWLLKYEAEVGHYARHVASIPYDNSGRKLNGSWKVEESQSKQCYEWDSDNDDTFNVDIESQEDSDDKHLDIMGFHPYKEVVFMVERYGAVAYHLNSTKIQHLGNSRQCYYHEHFSSIYESFLYTPCMIGDPLHGDQRLDRVHRKIHT